MKETYSHSDHTSDLDSIITAEFDKEEIYSPLLAALTRARVSYAANCDLAARGRRN